MVGNSSTYGYIQLSNSGTPYQCLEGVRLYGNGRFVRYDGDGSVSYEKYIANIPDQQIYADSDGYLHFAG